MQGQADISSAANPQPKRVRRTYLINPAFQWRYALTIGVVVFFIATMMSYVLYAGLHRQARMRLLQPTATATDATAVVVSFSLGIAVVSTGLVVFWCVLCSHRVCGPIYVLENYFKDLIGGRVPTPRPLRKKDEFKDLYAGFTRAMEVLREDRQNLLNRLTEVMVCLRTAGSADDAGRRRELWNAADQVEKMRSLVAGSLGCELPQVSNPRPAVPRGAPQEKPVAVG